MDTLGQTYWEDYRTDTILTQRFLAPGKENTLGLFPEHSDSNL